MSTTDFREMLNAVADFHNKFSIQNEAEPTEIPTQESELRAALMDEENREYAVAAKNNDIVGVADALGDQLYVLLGTVLRHGLQDKISEVFWEIHRSNLSKLGRSGEVMHRPDGKVMKGPDYFRPDIASILNQDN